MKADMTEQVKRFRQWQKKQQRRATARHAAKIIDTVEKITEIIGGHRIA